MKLKSDTNCNINNITSKRISNNNIKSNSVLSINNINYHMVRKTQQPQSKERTRDCISDSNNKHRSSSSKISFSHMMRHSISQNNRNMEETAVEVRKTIKQHQKAINGTSKSRGGRKAPAIANRLE